MKFEIDVNVGSTNFELGEHMSITVVVEAADVEEAVTKAAKLVGMLEGGNVYGVAAMYPEGYNPVTKETKRVIDLEALDWKRIQDAAKESEWMPPDYMQNDWVYDVCCYLKSGIKEAEAEKKVGETMCEFCEEPSEDTSDGVFYCHHCGANGEC